MVGVYFLFSSIHNVKLIYIFISAYLLTSGNVVLYMTYLSFLKHLPNDYMSSYLAGDYLGGMMITLLYLLLSSLGLKFKMVRMTSSPSCLSRFMESVQFWPSSCLDTNSLWSDQCIRTQNSNKSSLLLWICPFSSLRTKMKSPKISLLVPLTLWLKLRNSPLPHLIQLKVSQKTL